MTWLDYLQFFGIPVVLIGIVIYVFRPSARKAYRKAKRIPFDDS